MIAYARVVGTAIAALIALGGVAEADILSGGPLYGGASSVGGVVTCRFFNTGISNVTFSSRQIWANTGSSVSLISDSCNVAIAPGKYCAYSAGITGNFAYSCRAVINGIDNNVSGEMDIVVGAPAAVLFVLPLHQ
jgi:hypothetical protein